MMPPFKRHQEKYTSSAGGLPQQSDALWTLMDIWEPEQDDNDRVRAVKALLRLYERDHLRQSAAHTAVVHVLGKETVEWLRRGAPEQRKPLLSTAELTARLETKGASTGVSRFHKVLREIGTNLATLGQPVHVLREIRERFAPLGMPERTLPRGEYRVNTRACTFAIDGKPTIVTLAGPTPEDRGERARRGGFFLEPRYEEAPSERPPIVDIDLAPFASSRFQCLLEHPRAEGANGRANLRALFGGLPLTLFGTVGALSIIDSDDTEESYDEQLLAAEQSDGEASGLADDYGPLKRTYAEARLLDQEPHVTLDGSVRLHPDIPADKLVPVLDTWPSSFVRRIGFEFWFGDALLTELGGGRGAEAVFDAAVEALQVRGPILRNDPAIGLVGVIDPVAEIGLFCMSHSITVTFQRRNDGDLWRAVKNFPLNDLLVDVLRRFRPEAVDDDASL
jgi:hypothetical protein